MFTCNLNSSDSSDKVKPSTSQNSLKILQQDKARWKVILALNLLFEIAILILYKSYNSTKGTEQQVAWCHTKRCEMILNDHTESSLEIITYFRASFATFTLLGLVFESGYFMLTNSFLNLICFVHSFREFGDRNMAWALCLIFTQFIGTVIFIRKVRRYNEACHRYDISQNILNKNLSHQVKLIPSTIGKSTTEQPTTPPPDYHEFVSHPGQYPKPRTTTSFYLSTQILIPIVAITVFPFQVKGTIENNHTQIKIHEKAQNLNISCETFQLLYLNNKISDYCSLLNWITPDQVKCVTNTTADNSTDPNLHSRCTIECSIETFTKAQRETRNEWIKITQWLNIQSTGLSHSGTYSCKLNKTYGKWETFEFTEKPDYSCQYDDQCQSRICHQNLCRCHSANKNYLPDTDQCINRKKLNDSCQRDEECHFNAYQVHAALARFKPNFTQPSCISRKCQCPLGTVNHRIANNQICISKASHGEPCFINAQCELQSEQMYCFYNPEDYTDACQCKDGYRWSQDECVPIRKCVGKDDCGDGQDCEQGVCRCKDGFRWKRDECEPHRTCDSTSNCEYGQHCEQNVCKCKEGFDWKQGKCVQIRKCVGKDDCGGGQLCEQDVCWCKDGFIWKLGNCVQIRKCAGEKDCGDGQFCDRGVRCRCKDGFRWKLDECEPHRTCASNRSCDDGQHCEQNVCKCVSPETMDSRGKCYNLQLQIALWLISIILVVAVLIFGYLLRKFTTKSNSRNRQCNSDPTNGDERKSFNTEQDKNSTEPTPLSNSMTIEETSV